jgi:hypothetical protein
MSFRESSIPDMQTRDDESNAAAYQTEHWLAWLFAIVAIVGGVLGLLRGFAIIGTSVTVAGNTVPGTNAAGGNSNPLFDGFVWTLPAIAAALLSFALHNSGHHRHAEGMADDADSGLFKTEHLLAYLFAAGTIAAGVIALLVGFNIIGTDNPQPNGWLWGLTSIGLGTITNTLHTVRHHQLAAEEDYIAAMMDRRVSTMAAPPPMPGTAPVRDAGRNPRP